MDLRSCTAPLTLDLIAETGSGAVTPGEAMDTIGELRSSDAAEVSQSQAREVGVRARLDLSPEKLSVRF